jgi:hypothetical protein
VLWIGFRIYIGRLDSDPGPTEIEKRKEISCFDVLDDLFLGLNASPVVWTDFTEAYG